MSRIKVNFMMADPACIVLYTHRKWCRANQSSALVTVSYANSPSKSLNQNASSKMI